MVIEHERDKLFADTSRAGSGEQTVWIVVPTYNERDNIVPLSLATLKAVPQARLLIVDDGSPDGTGEIADTLAKRDPRIQVLHRESKQGLGAAYRHGFGEALSRGATTIVQMDCDFSHDPGSIPGMLDALSQTDLVLGSRYAKGGRTENWSRARKLISRVGCLLAQLALRLPYRDLTGGFKAWRDDLLEGIGFEQLEASGYGFQVEMTWRAHLAGARIVEVPIVFRERERGVSKMSAGIVVEALVMLLRLGVRRHPAGIRPPHGRALDRSVPWARSRMAKPKGYFS